MESGQHPDTARHSHHPGVGRNELFLCLPLPRDTFHPFLRVFLSRNDVSHVQHPWKKGQMLDQALLSHMTTVIFPT